MIYLDHAATSPLRPAAREAMAPWWGVPANPSSAHQAGQRAAAAVERARAQVADLVGAEPAEVVFTSGATEANHLFLRGAMAVRPGRLVVSPLEHPCVAGAADAVLAEGHPVDRLAVRADGRAVVSGLPRDTTVLSLMTANHETGIVQDLAGARRAAAEVGAWWHTDASHAAGRVPLDGVEADALVLSAHKVGGPVGVGALVLGGGLEVPALFPGSQERGRRGGTVDVAGVVGFGAAAEEAATTLHRRVARWTTLGTMIADALGAAGGRVQGTEVRRVASTVSAVFDDVSGEALVQALDLRDVCVSAGAACASGSLEPSPTLVAMGDPSPAGILRVSLGPDTTDDEVDRFLTALHDALGSLRAAAAWDADG